MSRLSITERVRLAALSADRSRRAAVAQALGSPLLRWRYGSAVAEQLLIVPQELRTSDPSLWHEFELGQFGLAGSIAHINDLSPFEIAPPNDAWARALHGFSWLRHLDAADNDAARDMARHLAVEWSIRHADGSGLPWEPAVASRRLISWMSHADMLLDGTDEKSYDALTESLGRQLVRLSARWRDAPHGYPRLLALTALVLADLCIAGHDRQLSAAERSFSEEISRQILADGGHVSRNPAILVEIMLDLLPLKQCFATRGRTVPPVLVAAMSQMLKMLRYIRMGDGRLARFNGMGVASPAALATVLAYDDVEAHATAESGPSRYARCERGQTVLVADVGPPPALELSGEAHAGALSFEVSVGAQLLFVNGGAPGLPDLDWRAASRSTASHSTLVLDEKSSSLLLRHAALEEFAGAPPIRGPEAVSVALAKDQGTLTIDAVHDGYLQRYGLLHARKLTLSADGRRIDGLDRLHPPKGALRLKRDLPFAIHFHLHPDVRCTSAEPQSATIVLANDAVWTFTVSGFRLSVEESIFFADSVGPRQTLQLVLRGTTPGETEVQWRVQAAS